MQDVLGGSGRGHNRDAAAVAGQTAQDIALQAVVDGDDTVVVINAGEVVFTGKKEKNKLYRWHTGYPGGLKERTAEWMRERDPTSLLREAVLGMLPKNKLRKARARRLRIFAGAEHDFEGAELETLEPPPRNVKPRVPLLDLPDGFAPVNAEAYNKKMRLYGLKEFPVGASPK